MALTFVNVNSECELCAFIEKIFELYCRSSLNRVERVPWLLPIHFKNPNLAPGRINLEESDPSHFPFEAQNAQYIHGENH